MQTQQIKPKRGCRWWLGRVSLGLLGLLVLFLVFTFINARVKDARVLASVPEGSLLVDIGGRNIHMRAMGLEHDGPAVVLIPCFACDSAHWQAVQPELAKTTRVYAYDPAGFAWSDPGPTPLTPSNAADDLHAALVALGEEEVILAGFSAGGLTVYNYYNRYPDNPRVVGLMWAEGDALVPEELEWYDGQFYLLPIPNSLVPPLIEFGIWRLGFDLLFKNQAQVLIPENVHDMVEWDYLNQVLETEGSRRHAYAMLGAIEAYPKDVQYTASLPLPTDVPVFALKADWAPVFEGEYGELSPEEIESLRQLDAARTQWYQMIAENSPGGRYIPVADCSHLIVFEQPQAVVDAIRDMAELVATQP